MYAVAPVTPPMDARMDPAPKVSTPGAPGVDKRGVGVGVGVGAAGAAEVVNERDAGVVDSPTAFTARNSTV